MYELTNISRPSARSVLLDVQDDSVSDEEIDGREKQFFNQLVLANGTLKTTFAGRLSDVNTAINGLLTELGREVRILDIAVSSGITTYEWARALDGAEVVYSMDAFDLCVDGVIYSREDTFNVLVDSDNRPLQFEVLGRVVENSFGESISRKLKRFVPVAALRVAHGIYRHLPGAYTQRIPVKLVTRHLRKSKNIQVFEYDLESIEQLPRSYDVIRAANILNLAYFDTSFIKDAVLKVAARLNSGGYFCVVRTHSDASNHGTVFKKHSGGLRPILSIGSGSEIESIVASIR